MDSARPMNPGLLRPHGLDRNGGGEGAGELRRSTTRPYFGQPPSVNRVLAPTPADDPASKRWRRCPNESWGVIEPIGK